MHGSLATPMDDFMARQKSLTPVERFAEFHSINTAPDLSRWEQRIPSAKPGKGQQYGFAVDLDACTGCKACVAACGSLNGLAPDEQWRRTGTLHVPVSAQVPTVGTDSACGTATASACGVGSEVRTVTSACHHCVDPACLNGCPAEAYEKDPITGIVRHLDDACIGCQYCTLMCPYDVPDYRKDLGIVRKCDMCTDRLAEGEAPACVQGCPQGAITISVVDTAEAVSAALSGVETLVPGAPDSGITVPTTRYVGGDLSGGFDATVESRPGHGHPPLVTMLVLTQIAVGTYVAAMLVAANDSASAGPRSVTFVALGSALVALAASVFHLGRPLLAWRAVLGIGHSWLSREIVAFSVFAALAVADAALRILFQPSGLLTVLVVASGVFGIWCSVEIYVATRRVWWARWRTALRFGSTAAIGGALLSTVMLASTEGGPSASWIRGVAIVGVTGVVVSLIAAGSGLWTAGRSAASVELAGTRNLLLHPLRDLVALRVSFALLGALLIPLALAVDASGTAADGMPTFWSYLVALCFVVAGEFLERHLFFVGSAPRRMPGEPK